MSDFNQFFDIFSKQSSKVKFHGSPSSGSPGVQFGWQDGRIDMTELTVAFRSFANAPNKIQNHKRDL